MSNQTIKEQLFETAVRCDSRADYLVVAALYLKAGCNMWPWHKGYKEAEDDDADCPFYGWEYAGFMKHRIAVQKEKVISINDLFSIVYGGGSAGANSEEA